MRDDISPPVKEGDVVNVKIESMGKSGDGMAKINGYILFIPRTSMGEEVSVKVTRVKPNVGFAEVVDENGEKRDRNDSESEISG